MIEEEFRGYIIQVGKDENENDELIAKASPEDYWLHLSNVPSPHCIIINPSGIRVHNKIIKRAAYLTKKHSKHANISKIDIDVTRIKFIKTTNKKGLVTVNFISRTINI